jgi:nucleoside-diphosphate-sugar epimerase
VAQLTGERVLVTGATGFIGSHLTRRLVDDGAEVHAVTSRVSSVWPVRLLDLHGRLTLHEADLADRGAMEVLADAVRPAYVFHLGAYTHVGKSWARMDECVQVNVQGTVNLLQALSAYGYERFVFTGTSEIYGDVDVPFREDAQVHPISPYAVSKYAAERFCSMFHLARDWPIVMLRPFNAYGPAQSPDRVVPEVIVRALRGQPLRMTQGGQTRELNYVEDLTAGFVAAAVAPGVTGEIINLGCGREVSVRAVTDLTLDLLGRPIEPEYGALPERPTEIRRMVSDPGKAQRLLGWAPVTSLEDGLARTIDWYRSELASPRSPFAL